MGGVEMRAVLFRVVGLGVLSLVAPVTASAQQTITVCGASKGKAFYLEPTQDGWVDDGISDGTVTFMRYPSGDYDVVMKNAANAFSARGDGARVVKVHGEDDNVATFVVVYPLHTTEVYQLTLNRSGRGTLIWSSLKNRIAPAGVTRGALFSATCAR
jgi:hypothetical protein